jgi:hypothetical protein
MVRLHQLKSWTAKMIEDKGSPKSGIAQRCQLRVVPRTAPPDLAQIQTDVD